MRNTFVPGEENSGNVDFCKSFVKRRMKHKKHAYTNACIGEKDCVAVLGHANVATTMIYLHVLNKGGRGIVSPTNQIT